MQTASVVALLMLQIIVLVTNPKTVYPADQSAATQLLWQAEQEAGVIGNEYLRENTLQDIAVAEAKANNSQKALEIASEITERDDKNLTLVEIAEVQAKSHHIKAAFRTAGKIDDKTDRAAAMESIALAQLAGGDHAGALHTASSFQRSSTEAVS